MTENAILAALQVENAERCTPRLDNRELRSIALSVSRYTPAQPEPTESVSQILSGADCPRMAQWPEPDTNVFYGLAGDIVRLIRPHSEADPVALLIQIFVLFGNIIGRTAHFVAEGDRHFTNLFAVLVGATSKGRKGTAWGRIVLLFECIEAEWKQRIVSGLSSGEGLIWCVRDPIAKSEPIREKKRIVSYQDVIIDQGVLDKRALIFEAEFASALRVLKREGNTLSALLRQAWDGRDLRALTKNSPAQATAPHISVVGHVTSDELRRYLDSTEAGNGFANRFLWVCSRRSNLLPEGGNLKPSDLQVVATRLSRAIGFAKAASEMKRDAQARELWFDVYADLSEGKPGLLGAVTSRAEAQTMRLACVYALLDLASVIRREHLEAALALWRYCEASASFVFGDSLGDTVADALLSSLRQRVERGMTRTEMRDLFARHRGAGEIDRALALLAEQGFAHFKKQDTDGRSAEVWFPLTPATIATKATE